MPSSAQTVPGTADGYHIQNGVTYPYHGTYDFALRASDQRLDTQRSKRSSSGWRPPLPWSHSHRHYEDPIGDAQITNLFNPAKPIIDATYGDVQGVFGPELNFLPSPPSSLLNAALNQALANLSQGQIGLGEDFGQRQQTADMIADRANSIGDSVYDFSNRHPSEWADVKRYERGVRRNVKKIPLRWLELQYGWVPLLLDCKGAFDEMKRVDKDGPPERICVKAFRKGTEVSYRNGSVYGFPPPTGGSYGSPALFQVDVVRKASYGCFVRLDYEMVNPVLASLQKLGLANPAAIAWELVPYSFVVDWFLPIGSYLNAWTGDLGYRFIGGSRSIFQSMNARLSDYKLLLNGFQKGSGSLSGGGVKNWAVARSVYKTAPGPAIPSFKNPLSLGHFANAMSLLVSAMRR